MVPQESPDQQQVCQKVGWLATGKRRKWSTFALCLSFPYWSERTCLFLM